MISTSVSEGVGNWTRGSAVGDASESPRETFPDLGDERVMGDSVPSPNGDREGDNVGERGAWALDHRFGSGAKGVNGMLLSLG